VGHLISRGVADIERPIKGTVIYHSAPAKLAPQTIAELDAVSAYPKIDANSSYGKVHTPHHGATDKVCNPDIPEAQVFDIAPVSRLYEYVGNSDAQVFDIAPVSRLYEYVGKMEAFSIIRDESEELFVAMPLRAFLDRE
jgi:hypothetical protein